MGAFNSRMIPSSRVSVAVNLSIVRGNAQRIAEQTRSPILAVVKSDAYGLGTQGVSRALADLVDGFCVFSLREAQTADLWRTAGKPILSIGPQEDFSAGEFIEAHVRPAVWTAEQARRFARAEPVLSVDTGMQRFTAGKAETDAMMREARFTEAFTHAVKMEQAVELAEMFGGKGMKLHAAGSALLNEPRARLDAVRPGIALYRGAVRVATRLLEARDSNRSAGYSGFVTPRLGVIPCGYSSGLRKGLCVINGIRQAILEVGMQSAYVEAGESDRAGDEVILLGDGLTEAEVAGAWMTSEHQALLCLTGMGIRRQIT